MGSVKSVLYADDTIVITRDYTFEDLVIQFSKNRNKAVTQFFTNLLKLNPEKNATFIIAQSMIITRCFFDYKTFKNIIFRCSQKCISRYFTLEIVCSIVLWRNTSYAIKLLVLQKRPDRIITDVGQLVYVNTSSLLTDNAVTICIYLLCSSGDSNKKTNIYNTFASTFVPYKKKIKILPLIVIV